MSIKRVTLLFTIILTMAVTACNSETQVAEKPQPLASQHQQTIVDWQRVTNTIDEYTFPESELIFAPREEPSDSESRAQARHKIRYNRHNKHYAFFKTSAPINKIVEFYTKQGLKLQPVTRPDQRVLFSESKQTEIIVTQVENAANITIGVSSFEPPAVELANDIDSENNTR